MARNQEKSMTMLNRYLQGKNEEKRGPRAKRPYLSSECHDLVEADKWRQQILREVAKKVMEIQNGGLGEHRIRDLNDEINKLIREKGHWERRIVELGGPDYQKAGPAVTDSKGRQVADLTGKGTGYSYFGAAKLLPGVKELFEEEPPKKVRKTRHQMVKSIDPDYYGFRDEDDGVLVKLEEVAEAEMRAQAVLEYEEQAHLRAGSHTEDGVKKSDTDNTSADDTGSLNFVAYVPLPDQKEIEARVLERKKADLLARYTTPALVEKQQEAKDLLNIRN